MSNFVASTIQSAAAACMVRPAHFGFNPETAVTNHLQQPGIGECAADAAAGRAEFDAMVLKLRAAGIRIGVLDDEPQPALPDSVFPNNWISFHPDGTVVLYPMQSASRRNERRPTALLAVASALGFEATRTVDFTAEEVRGRYLEGTGSLVLDHRERVAYCALSPRSDAGLAGEWAAELGYELEAFDAATATGASIYHTNVLLWIGERLAGLGLDWIAPTDRPRVRERLAASGRQLVDLPAENLAQFAGNMLELRSTTGRLVLVMSASAAASLDPAQRAALLGGTDELLIAAVPTIELRGGGSVRCMLAEVP